MRLAEVQRRAREARKQREVGGWLEEALATMASSDLYRDTLRTLLDHDLPDDARQFIEAALEAER